MEILSLGEKIKRKRKELNMTLKDLAGDRITPGQISLVESGKSNPSMDLLEYLSNALHTSIEYLMESEESQAESICTYFENIAESYILNGDFNQGEQYIEKALYYAEKFNLEYRKAKNLYLRGIIYMEKEELSYSQQFFLSANVIFIKNNCYEEVVNTFIKLGSITFKLKAYQSSNSYFQQAEKVFKDNDIGNDFLLGQIYYYIAFTYYKVDNLEKAISYSFLAKEKFRQIDEKSEYAKSLMLLSQEYSEKGDVSNAIKYSKKTLDIYRQINDNEYVSEIENSLGNLFSKFENMEESFIHLYKAKDMREKNNDVKLIETLVSICENYIRLKDIEQSKAALSEVLSYVQRVNGEALIEYYLLKYRVDILEGKDEEAENTLLLALGFVKNLELTNKVAEIAIMIGKFYMDKGRDKEAAQYLSEGVETFKKLKMIKEV